ncbi:MAG: hypothetical protein Q8R92_03830 [Deltaproteobacteria bacterium]|nr:hypothetical protein [Deltaproteobacteria bacterium]
MKRAIQTTFLVVGMMLLGGCDYGSEVPLGAVNEASIDEQLVGMWTCVRRTPKEVMSGETLFLQFNDREYYLQMSGETRILSEPDKEQFYLTSFRRAYSTEIFGTTFLNVQNITVSGKRRYVFYSYSMPSPDKLIIQFVDMNLFPQDLSTIEEARRIVQEKINNPDLYEDDAMKCQRVQEN